MHIFGQDAARPGSGPFPKAEVVASAIGPQYAASLPFQATAARVSSSPASDISLANAATKSGLYAVGSKRFCDVCVLRDRHGDVGVAFCLHS
jgi:hypothetical protein